MNDDEFAIIETARLRDLEAKAAALERLTLHAADGSHFDSNKGAAVCVFCEGRDSQHRRNCPWADAVRLCGG